MTVEQIIAISKDPKSFLSQLGRAKGLIAAKQERIDYWRRKAESITVALKPDGGLNAGGYKQSLVENAVCNIVALEAEILAEIEALVELERDIRDAINQFVVEDKYKRILELRYLNGYSWRQVGAGVYYGEDWVCRLHHDALQELKANAEIALLGISENSKFSE